MNPTMSIKNIYYLIGVAVCSLVKGQTDNPLYPPNSLLNVGELYNFGGVLPPSRVHHTAVFLEPYVLIYGGASEDGKLLDDIHMYDYRYQKWTGAITRQECCNAAEEVVQRLGSTSDQLVDQLPIGFQGGLPAARSDHAVAVSNGQMFMFGGFTEFGLMNDMFAFDPVALRWNSIINVGLSWPCRRGGHSLHAANEHLYLFGGRTETYDDSYTSLSDVWIFDIKLNTWTIAIDRRDIAPLGRQHAATTIYGSNLWVFGGMDVYSELSFNDMWSFHLDTHRWKQHSPNSGNLHGFIPPPMHHAHLIPTTNDPGVLVYGGIGGGGACGGSRCNAELTVIGQVYRFDITTAEWNSVLDTDFTSSTNPATSEAVSGDWQYARVSSDLASGTGASSKLTKTVALERIAVSEDRFLIFEFGGVEFTLNNGTTSKSQEIPDVDTLTERSTQGTNYHDAGGVLHNDPWDLYTGEHTRENIEIPINSKWWYLNDPYAVYGESSVSFLRQFRQYTLGDANMVLLTTDRIDKSSPG
jgi:hypothetical protein